MTPLCDDLMKHLKAEESRLGREIEVLEMPPTYLAMIASEFGLPYGPGSFFSMRLTDGRRLTVASAVVH